MASRTSFDVGDNPNTLRTFGSGLEAADLFVRRCFKRRARSPGWRARRPGGRRESSAHRYLCGGRGETPGSCSGKANVALAHDLQVSNATVGKWRRRFLAHSRDGLLPVFVCELYEQDPRSQERE